MVGTNTARRDNPSLTVRDWEGRSPIRILIDNDLNLDRGLNLFNNEVETLVFNKRKSEINGNLELVLYDGSLEGLLEELYNRNIQSMIVEGGTLLLQSFIEKELWDEARVFTAEKEFEKGIAAPDIGGLLLSDNYDSGDRLEIYQNVH